MDIYRDCELKEGNSFYDKFGETIKIKWKGKQHKEIDLYNLSEAYFFCAYEIVEEITENVHDNVKLDMWFLPGVYLFRQSLELMLKALLAKSIKKNNILQELFVNNKHDLEELFKEYSLYQDINCISFEEKEWLQKYLSNIEIVDENSSLFRYPFKDDFLRQYQNEFLDIVDMGNNFLNAFVILKKCFTGREDIEIFTVDVSRTTDFLIFSNHGFGNCQLWESPWGDGFHKQVVGYSMAAHFLYEGYEVDKNSKRIFPIIFLLRNAIELTLKRLLYAKVKEGIEELVVRKVRNSHILYKDLWKAEKDMLFHYATEHGENTQALDVLEEHIIELNHIDKQGDTFRYPFTYSFEYKMQDKELDMKNVYQWMQGMFNILDGCDGILDEMADFEYESQLYEW